MNRNLTGLFITQEHVRQILPTRAIGDIVAAAPTRDLDQGK